MTFADRFAGLEAARRRRARVFLRQVDCNDLLAWALARGHARVTKARNRYEFQACKPCLFSGRRRVQAKVFGSYGREMCTDCAAKEAA